MNLRNAALLSAFGLGLIPGMIGHAAADEWDQKTIFTFSGPVEIPGQVLSAGTYVFKLADSSSDRNIVQVFSKDERHLYGTFLSISDERIHPAGKPIITFDERTAGSPEAVKAWFYPGENLGHEFVYPKPRAAALAKANNTPVPSMPAALAANTTKSPAPMSAPHIQAMRQAPLKAQTPAQEEVEIAEVFVAQDVPPPAPVGLPAKLPTTASDLPLIAIAGFLLLGVGGAMRLILRGNRA